MTHAEQVLIRGKCFLYKQKAPFVPSGKSVFGALEYDENTGMVRCHECGKWFTHLGHHVSDSQGVHSHRMKALDYKRKHGLRRAAALCGPKESAKYNNVANLHFLEAAKKVRARAIGACAKAKRYRQLNGERLYNAESRNERNTCQAQILSRIKAISESLGRTPTHRDLRQHGLHASSVVFALNVPDMKSVFSLLGLLPNRRGGKETYTDSLLIELLRDFYVKFGRLPKRTDYIMKLLPSDGTIRHHFGSMAAAYEAAGLGKVASAA